MKAFTKTSAETKSLAEKLGAMLKPPSSLALIGDLGAGKTCFVQGLARTFDLTEAPVSPTFIVISEHDGKLPLLHSDLYRVEKEDLPGLGIEEILELWPGVSVVEWANLHPEIMPENTIWISLKTLEDGREITAWSDCPISQSVIEAWLQNDA